MTCQAIAEPGPDGFAIPGIPHIIPLMPEQTCLASSRLLADRYPELRYQEGILVMHVGGEMRQSVRHAWNVGPGGEIVDTTNRPMTVWPGQEVTYSYIPDDAKHDAERLAVAAVIGEPSDFEDDPDREGDRLAIEWLARARPPRNEDDPVGPHDR